MNVMQRVKAERGGLREKKVGDVVAAGKRRRLVEVPYTASVGHTLNALVANRVVAVPVAAPPGHWIGAGGSMIMESDKLTGAIRKHYIGKVTMLDILAHIGDGDGLDFEGTMSVPVSSVIGHCLEGLSLWTLNPNTSIVECMEMFSKGIHRALVPVEGQMENIAGVELVESASTYQMLTQMDVVRWVLKEHRADDQLMTSSVFSRTVGELGVVQDTAFGVGGGTKVMDAIKCMKAASLSAVPVIQLSSHEYDDSTNLINGKGRKLIGTFSATDLRGCPLSQLQAWLSLNVMEFKEVIQTSPLSSNNGRGEQLVTCLGESSFGEAIDKAVTNHVHRLWVVDEQGLLLGLVSLTDMIRVIRISLLSDTSG